MVGGDLKMVGRRLGIWPGTEAPLELGRLSLRKKKGEEGGADGVERLREMDKDATLAPRMASTWPWRARRRGCSTRGRRDFMRCTGNWATGLTGQRHRSDRSGEI